MRVAFKLFDDDGTVLRYIPKRQAFDLMAEGKIEPCDPMHPNDPNRGLVFVREPAFRMQAKTLHEYAILKHKCHAVGGMTRTETKPIDRFKNSR